jgi:hypothetical protein
MSPGPPRPRQRSWRAAAVGVTGWAALGSLATACNAIFGLDDVRLADRDGGAGGRGTGGATIGTGGAASGGATGATGGAASGGATGATGGRNGGGGGAGGSPCLRELSRNASFDMGMTSWNEVPLRGTLVFRHDDPQVVGHAVTPHSGDSVLRLGAPNGVDEEWVIHYIEQYIDIPNEATEVTISGYLQVRTEEPPAEATEYDYAYVMIFDEFQQQPPFYRSTPRWTNLTQAPSWTRFSFNVDVTAVPRQEMVFRIMCDLDGSKPTYFYFDSVSVAVTACAPASP